MIGQILVFWTLHMSGFLGEPEKTLSLYDARADFYADLKVENDAGFIFYATKTVTRIFEIA